MKKWIGLFLAVSLAFTFCACGKGGDSAEGEKDVVKTASDVLDDMESMPEGFSLGRVEDDVYQNDFIGIGYQLDKYWSFYDEDQIKQLNSLAMEKAGEDIEETILDATIFYDMYATDNRQLNNITVSLEKIDATQLENMSIADNFAAVAPTAKEGLINMGYEDVNYELTTVEVDGQTLDALRTTSVISGMNMYQTVFQKKCDGYLASITITVYSEDTTAQLLENFFWTE